MQKEGLQACRWTGRFCTDVMGSKVKYRTSDALFVDRSSQVTTTYSKVHRHETLTDLMVDLVLPRRDKIGRP